MSSFDERNYRMRFKTSEFKEKIRLVLNLKGNGIEKDEDGKPIKNKTVFIDTRAKLKYAYGTEYLSTEKERNVQKITFFVRKRKALKGLDFKGNVIFDNKEFNIKYVNVVNDNVLEIRGEFYGETKN